MSSAGVGEAHLCTQQLVQQIVDLVGLPKTTPADRTSLTGKVLECRDIVGRMQVEEAVLLNERGSEESQDAYHSLIAGGVFLIISLAVVLSLFGFLVRDARRRMKTEGELSYANQRLHSMVQTLEKQAQDERLLTSLRQELQLCTTPSEVQRTVGFLSIGRQSGCLCRSILVVARLCFGTEPGSR